MKHKGYCVKILYGELEALEIASILICSLGGVDSSSSNGFKVLHFIPSLDGEGAEGGWGAFRRVGTYNKNRSFQWKIENGKSLPSSSAEGWRSSLLRKTSWVPELCSRTTSAIHPYIHNYPSSGLRPPSPARGEGNALYLHTSEPRRCA